MKSDKMIKIGRGVQQREDFAEKMKGLLQTAFLTSVKNMITCWKRCKQQIGISLNVLH